MGSGGFRILVIVYTECAYYEWGQYLILKVRLTTRIRHSTSYITFTFCKKANNLWRFIVAF